MENNTPIRRRHYDTGCQLYESLGVDSFICEGRLAACYNNSISRNHYLGKDADSIFKEKVDSLDSLYRDSKWKVGELNYYIHSHSVLDAGYNSICAYTQHELELRDSAKKLLDSLKHVQKRDISS